MRNRTPAALLLPLLLLGGCAASPPESLAPLLLDGSALADDGWRTAEYRPDREVSLTTSSSTGICDGDYSHVLGTGLTHRTASTTFVRGDVVAHQHVYDGYDQRVFDELVDALERCDGDIAATASRDWPVIVTTDIHRQSGRWIAVDVIVDDLLVTQRSRWFYTWAPGDVLMILTVIGDEEEADDLYRRALARLR